MASSNTPVRVAFISVAHIHSKSFLKDLAAREDAQVVAIWDDVADRGRAYARDFGTRFVERLEDLLSDGEIDAFVVCAENTRHLPLLERVLPLGKATLCEKPLATSSADARRIGELVARHGTPLTSGYFQPFFAHHRKAAELIAGGALGKVTHLFYRNAHHAAYGRWFDNPELAWFTDPELAGGGALLDMGTHAAHLLLHLAGAPAVRVRAEVANVSGIYPKVDDWGVIEIAFADGKRARVEAAWVATAPVGNLEVWGSDAGLTIRRIDDREVPVLTPPDKPAVPQPADPAAARPDRMARLVALARGELSADEVAADLRASLQAVHVLDAAYQSARAGGREVEVEQVA